MQDWTIPGTDHPTRLTVVPAAFRKHASVRLDGREVAKTRLPDAGTPWIETAIQGDPSTVLALVHVPPIRDAKVIEAFRADVFVNGKSVTDGTRLDDWRKDAPRPKDKFERAWGTDYLKPPMAPFYGLVAAAPVAASLLTHFSIPLLIAAVMAFIFATLYVQVILFPGIGALIRRETWLTPIRNLLALSLIAGWVAAGLAGILLITDVLVWPL